MAPFVLSLRPKYKTTYEKMIDAAELGSAEQRVADFRIICTVCTVFCVYSVQAFCPEWHLDREKKRLLNVAEKECGTVGDVWG